MKPGDLVRSIVRTDQYFTDEPRRIGFESMKIRSVPRGALGVVLQGPIEVKWAQSIYFVKWMAPDGRDGWSYSSHLEAI